MAIIHTSGWVLLDVDWNYIIGTHFVKEIDDLLRIDSKIIFVLLHYLQNNILWWIIAIPKIWIVKIFCWSTTITTTIPQIKLSEWRLFWEQIQSKVLKGKWKYAGKTSGGKGFLGKFYLLEELREKLCAQFYFLYEVDSFY